MFGIEFLAISDVAPEDRNEQESDVRNASLRILFTKKERKNGTTLTGSS